MADFKRTKGRDDFLNPANELKTNIYYDDNGTSSILTKPTYLVNYSNRIPDGVEGIDSLGVVNDHFTSVSVKGFYYKTATDSLKSSKVKFNALNNLWYNDDSSLLQI